MCLQVEAPGRAELQATEDAPAAPAYFVPWLDKNLINVLFFARELSTIFDLGTIVILYLLARRLYDRTVGLISAACVAFTVLHIQLAHYYAVDTLLTLLCAATIYFAARYAQIGRTREAVWLSIAFGLARFAWSRGIRHYSAVGG